MSNGCPLSERLMMRARTSSASLAACVLLDEVASILARLGK
jgi:hypothetical protein